MAPTVLCLTSDEPKTRDHRIQLTCLGDQDFFQKAIGNVKKVLLSYGPNGRSRGEATVIFNKLTKAAEAMSKYNGVKVDDKPLRVRSRARRLSGVRQLIPFRSRLLAALPSSNPRRLYPTAWRKHRFSCLCCIWSSTDTCYSKPKSAVKENAKAVAKKVGPKPATNGAAKPAKADKKKAGRAGRPKAKTADELDAEMQDYFKVEAPAAATNGEAAAAPAAAATNGGSMETDEVL